MTQQIDLLQVQAIEYLSKFLCAFDDACWSVPYFVPSIEYYAAGCTQATYLACINKLKVFEDRHKDEWLGIFVACIDDRQIDISYGATLPERFKVVDIVVKERIVDPGVVVSVQW